MKLKFTYAVVRSCTLFLSAFMFAFTASSQAPIYKFKNPTLISGTGGQVNAVYRFPNVYTSGTNYDALVKIQDKVGNITLQNIDRTADGYDEAFQPEYKIGSLTNAYFEFLITFVIAGTNTPAAQPVVDLSCLDIDGSTKNGLSLKEFNRVDMGGGICTFSTLNSELTMQEIGRAFEGDNYTGNLFGALVDTAAKEVMFSVTNTSVSSFIYRAGANSILNAQSTRYASLYFKKFNYPQGGVLSVRNLASFSGTAEGDKVKLTWTLTDGNNADNVAVEKSYTGESFQPIVDFWVNAEGNYQKDFSYTDSKNTGNVLYYRLKIEGKDGKVQYSNVLRFSTKQSASTSISVYPSVVNSTTTLSYNAVADMDAVVFVADMSGRIVKQTNLSLQRGNNSILLSGFERFNRGNYIVSVSAGGQRTAKQIIVQ